MPIIIYHRFTEADADKARQILGIAKVKTMRPSEEVEISPSKIQSISRSLKIEYVDAKRLALAVSRGIPGFFYFNHEIHRSYDEPNEESEIHINIIGNKMPKITGTAVAHEIGHSQIFLKTWPGIKDRIAWDGVMNNYVLNELIATYYSEAKLSSKSLFQKSMVFLKKKYDKIKEENPEVLHGASFEDLKTEAALIVTRDLGVEPRLPSNRMKTIYKAGSKRKPPKRMPPSLGALN